MFGFFGAVVNKCAGQPWKYKKLLETQAEVYYTTTAYEVKLDDYHKELHKIKNPKQP
ncbi:hypothetical protein [Adhaeribacter aquaticus]|uniref:hypothetical protein n=1 Tax=Adhaeribacter aquaticus TaxID=299567 RepID=UPI0004083DDF|nr:hypothetical protein [Adhaeribacter aquaticus]